MPQQSKKFRRGLDIINRLPIDQIKNNVHLVSYMDPENTNLYFSQIDTTLEVVLDTTSHREFLACDFNRVGDSFRSPFSKEYFPPLQNNEEAPKVLSDLEDFANNLYSAYAFLYFGECICSSYIFEEDGMIVVSLIHKQVGPNEFWDSIHLACVDDTPEMLSIKLLSTVLLSCQRSTSQIDGNISGTVTNKIEREFVACSDKQKIIRIIGSLIEEAENRIRNSMGHVYFDKNRAIFNSLCPSNERSFLADITRE